MGDSTLTLNPNILDLPDELLMRIFGYVKVYTGKYNLYLSDFKHGNVDAVKRLRLTCRRFCKTSSHLLLYYVTVGMTHASLAHLEEVPRHPSVYRGVRTIWWSPGFFYNSILAHNVQAFAAYLASKLRRSIRDWGRAIELQKAVPLTEAWDEVAARRIHLNCAHHRIISRAHEEYLQLYEDQMDISKSLAQAIASAMTRMPTVTWVEIDD
ncbi:hypothetical protein GGR53DRAFT_219319 [Hypoxylon sp. FL1150]|nr:hypothetical protein GGR53DRAFT_219319 [Hypoxylon sp. FL1150]